LKNLTQGHGIPPAITVKVQLFYLGNTTQTATCQPFILGLGQIQKTLEKIVRLEVWGGLMGHNRWKVRLARTRLGDGILGQEEWYFPLAHGASPATHTGFTTVLGGWKCISGRGDIPFPLPKKVVKIC
jgi:hypothetical protein